MDDFERDVVSGIDDILFNQQRKKRTPINIATVVSTEFGLAGRDAEEFLYAFAKRYSVDFSDFVFTDYFAEEADLVGAIKRWFSGHRRKPLTVAMLVEAARHKRWSS